jgi:hypothetical protein
MLGPPMVESLPYVIACNRPLPALRVPVKDFAPPGGAKSNEIYT